MFITELAAPFLIFCGRRARQIACGAFVLFMLLISLTGNYCFFNLLTVALCLLLLDDAFLLRLLPSSAAAFVNRRLTPPVASGSQPQEASRPEEVPRPVQSRSQTLNLPPVPPEERRRPADAPVEFPLRDGSGVGSWKGLRTIGVALLAAIVLVLSGLETVARLFRVENLPRPALQLLRLASPLRTVNSYGLFAVMTTTRPEIVVEGSNDGVTWLPYEFKWKPGELKRRPAFVAPHQPRLDWQMWFAALGDYRREPWFMNFLVRLLQGSPEVLALLQKNPFPSPPPRSVRAVLYEYRFTDAAHAARPGNGGSASAKDCIVRKSLCDKINEGGIHRNSTAVVRHATLGTLQSKRGVGNLSPLRLAFSASDRPDLSHRICFAGSANQRTGG